MDQIIEILKTLGINETLFIQFIPFFIAYLAMSFLIFKPYLKAYEERLACTTGEEELAGTLLRQAEQKQEEYRTLARKLNTAIVSIFSEFNEKAEKETEELLLETKKDMEKQICQWKKELNISVSQAKKEMEKSIPDLSREIQRKFKEF